jgi:hypothetical protein
MLTGSGTGEQPERAATPSTGRAPSSSGRHGSRRWFRRQTSDPRRSGSNNRIATHSPVGPPAGGRLHGPDDAQVEPREVDAGRRAIASASHLTAHGSSWVVPRPPPGEGQDCLPGAGLKPDQPVPAVVRCRERQQDVAPVEGLIHERPQRYLLVGAF